MQKEENELKKGIKFLLKILYHLEKHKMALMIWKEEANKRRQKQEQRVFLCAGKHVKEVRILTELSKYEKPLLMILLCLC